MAVVDVPLYAVPQVQRAAAPTAERHSYWRQLVERISCCATRARVLETDSISHSPTDVVKPLPRGKWLLQELDLDVLSVPLAVVNDGKSNWLRILSDNSLRRWPVQLVRTVGTVRHDYDTSDPDMVLVSGSWFRSTSDALGAYSPLRSFPNPSNPKNHFLVWRLGDTMCFKLAHHSGWNSVRHDVYDELFNTYQRSSHVSMSGIINRLVQIGYDYDHARHLGSSLIALFGGTKESRSTDYFVYMTHTNEVHEDVELESKPYVHEESGAVVEHPAVFPAILDSNEQAAITLRLHNVNPGEFTLTANTIASVRAFADVFRPKSLVVPCSPEDVLERQKSNTRARVENAIQNRDFFGATEVASFVKREAYPSPKDPRNISNVCAEHNTVGFEFLLPLKEHLKTLSWYGPGRDPEAVVHHLNEAIYGPREPVNVDLKFVTSKEGFPVLLEGDYSRFDGSQAEVVRRCSFDIMKEWLIPEERERFSKLIDEQFAATARLPNGTRYYQLGSMLSGSWATTDGNTILNALVTYHALRLAGLGRRLSSYFIGVCFGDDGLCREMLINGKLFSEWWMQAAADFKLKLEIIKRPDGIAGYLSRYFEFGTCRIESSVPDLNRLLPKFKQSVSQEKEPAEIFLKKFSALYYLAGETTPVLSAYLRKWFFLTKQKVLLEFSDGDLPYWIASLKDLDTVSIAFMPCSSRLRDWVLEECASGLRTCVAALVNLEDAINASSSIEELHGCYIARDPAGISELVTMRGDRFVEATKTIAFEPKPTGKAEPKSFSTARPATKGPKPSKIVQAKAKGKAKAKAKTEGTGTGTETTGQ